MKNGVLRLAPFFMAISLCVGEIPPDILASLSADDFKERESAQVELLAWSRKRPAASAASLLQVSRSTDDPELRRRALAILKTLSDEDYLAEGSGYLGINMQGVMLPQAEGDRPRVGILILEIMPDGPAARAGLKRGDLILGLNGGTWHDLGAATTQFSDKISRMKPLTEVGLLVQRGAAEPEEMKVSLGKRPIEDLQQARESLQLLDEQAREKHFQEWLRGLDLKVE